MLSNLQRHTVNVNRPTPAKGTSGAERDTYATAYAAMPCLVIDAAASWRVIYAQRKMDLTHQVYTNAGPSILTGDQIVWQGRTLMVIGVYDLKGKGYVTQIDTQELY